MSAALLAKLTAKGLIIDGSPMGGGIVEISQSDVAGALGFGRLSDEGYKYARAKWCDDQGYARELQAYLPAVVWVLFNKEKNIKVSQSEAAGMATVALLQGLGGYNCPTCWGSGEIRHKVCAGCAGTGRGSMRKAEKAGYVGKSRQAYGQVWDKRVKEVEVIVQGWEQAGLAHIYRQFAAQGEAV